MWGLCAPAVSHLPNSVGPDVPIHPQSDEEGADGPVTMLGVTATGVCFAPRAWTHCGHTLGTIWTQLH
jgi:hypothetical protein